MLSADSLQQLAASALSRAKALGATECAVQLGCDQGLQLRVRLGKPDQLEYHNSRSGAVVVYRGKAKASVRTNQLDDASLREAVEQAFAAAAHAASDDCAGLADPAYWAREFRDLDTYHPYDLAPEEALELATSCEASALASDQRLVNSEGAECSGSTALDCLAMYSADSRDDFNQVERSSSFSLGCALIGQGQEQQQVGYWYDNAIDFAQLQSPAAIAAKAAQNTLDKLDASSIASGRFPVLFDAQMARALWRMLFTGISGGPLYRKASVFHDKIDTQLFPAWLNCIEEPHLPGYPGSANYDAEGVATTAKTLLGAGVLSSYLLDSYSARKLHMQTTGNAGGTSNVLFRAPVRSFDQLLKDMHTGLIVRETMGSGLNLITGDFSVGASGQWVEKGAIAHPVQLVTISGNLLDMFARLVALGDDVDNRFALRTGSLLLNEMHLGGSGEEA